MKDQLEIPWQPSLLDAASEPSIDENFGSLERVQLDANSWVDYAPGWVSAPESLFAEVLESKDWGQRSRRMYDKVVMEPRLTAPWRAESGEPLTPLLAERMRQVLSDRYERDFDSAGFNLYRDGRDSVAWHRDKIKKEVEDPIVALVALGDRRKFLLRPYGGGKSTPFALGDGDLLVTGGKTQRTWEHAILKVANAGPRISIAFRHGMDPKAYSHKTTHPPR
ncbi:MAG: alpha-ketoglutarate-dependent dioxygenase AlkB [Actinomycetota bacterium]|nr:alpha-ketoglutarate-dependent dioxygenase AlkB [Actinomycetota bacterium]